MYVWVCTHECVPCRVRKEGVGFPEIGGYELPSVSAGNQAESSENSKPT